MMMFPMLTEETPTYICLSGLDCDEAGMGKISRAAPITIADIVLPKELRRVMITSNQTGSQHFFSYGSGSNHQTWCLLYHRAEQCKTGLFRRLLKKTQRRGARFSLFVFVARVRKTTTITYHEHD